jgi:hypothetical protein
MSDYVLIPSLFPDTPDLIQRTSDGAIIPQDEGNRDYRAVLEWVEQGNVLAAQVVA